jgi:hypothetical protein
MDQFDQRSSLHVVSLPTWSLARRSNKVTDEYLKQIAVEEEKFPAALIKMTRMDDVRIAFFLKRHAT